MPNAVPPPPAPVLRSAPQGFALWDLGFRPFYLLAGAFAVITIACWVAQFAGTSGSHIYLAGPLWHAHEMIFGYAFAVITGFLFTAVRNWTGSPTPSGNTLAAIAVLWLAGRILVVTPWPALAALADTAFAVAAAAGIAVPLIKSSNRRNYFFIGLLLAMGAVNLAFHLAMAHWIDLPVERDLQIGLDLILFVIAVMGGRVIPMFTANTVPGSHPIRLVWVERTALAAVLALTICDLFGLPPTAVALMAAAAGISHAARLFLWQPWRTTSHPILWILHVSYAWIPIHLALRALAAFGFV
ncbi:MAG: NnrS family protein, partial [Sulfuricaulis sp.]|nr:NnrS family protein [Sulfuricaulis sp.]